jgi:hypothetical protein
MLNQTQGNGEANDTKGPVEEKSKSILVVAPLMSVIAGLIGVFLGLALYPLDGRGSPLQLAAIIGLFGGVVGFIVGLLVGSVRKLKELPSHSPLRMISTFALLGAMAGALILFPFSEGLGMVLYLAFEGAIAGGTIGILLGLLIRLSGRRIL